LVLNDENLNFLCLSESKTEMVVFGHPDHSAYTLGPLGFTVGPSAENMAFIPGGGFKFDRQIS